MQRMGKIVAIGQRPFVRRLATIVTLQICAIVAAQALVVGPDEAARLKAGEALISVVAADGADGDVKAVIDVPAPPSRVWDVLLECERAPQFMPNLKGCSVIQRGPLGRDGQTLWDEREHRISWLSIMPDLKTRFRSDYTFQKEIRFRKTTGDLDALDGAWSLEAIEGGRATRLRYSARIGFSALVPGFMIRSSLESDFPGFLQALKAEMIK